MTWHAVRSPAARRGFALAALATGVAPLVLTVSVLLRDPLELIVAVLLVGCAVAAAWAALVRRGRRRVPAAVITVLALAATAALPGLRAYLWFLVVAALAALSAGARPGLHWGTHPPVPSAGPARRVMASC